MRGASVEAVSAFLDHSSLAVTTVHLRRLEGQADETWGQVAAAIGCRGAAPQQSVDAGRQADDAERIPRKPELSAVR